MFDDLAHAEHLPDPVAIVRALQLRYVQRQPYTMCSDVCISVNPLEWLPIYDEATRRAYARREANGAHMYRVVEKAHSSSDAGGQTIVITGESGAGKTEIARLSMEYIASKNADDDLLRRVLLTHPVLEYIGNAQTLRNGNSSRFGKLLTLSSTYRGRAATIETYLLEKTRAAAVAPGEGNFRVFYALLGDSKLREEYGLQTLPPNVLGVEEPTLLSEWGVFADNMRGIGLSDSDVDFVVTALVAMLWLSVRDMPSAARAFGVEPSELTQVVNNRRTRVSDTEVFWSECDTDETRARIRALIMEIYRGMFSRVVSQVNASINNGDAQASTVGEPTNVVRILDLFGFEVFDVNGFDQLCINYCNERMQKLFVDDIIVMQQLEYANEGIGWTHVEFDGNARIVEMIERTLFVQLDEATRLRATPQSFVERMNAQRPFAFSTPLVRADVSLFSVAHFAGQVAYTADQFVARNSDELRDELLEFLRATRLSDVVVVAPISSDAAALWTETVSARFRRQMQDLTNCLLSGGCHYVRCIKPNADAQRGTFDSGLVTRQVVQSGLVQAYEVMRSGFAYRMTHAAFILAFPAVCARRVRRRELVGEGGRWGKTLVYLDASAHRRLRDYQAASTLARRVRRWLVTERARVRLQMTFRRRSVARRAERRRSTAAALERAAVFLQQYVRARANAGSRRCREQTELARLREHTKVLAQMLQERDAWIFRATRILQARSGMDERIARVLAARPAQAPPSTSEVSATKSSDFGAATGGGTGGLTQTSPP